MNATRVPMEIPVQIVPIEDCKKDANNQNIQHQICTRTVDEMRATHGDSGGPIFQLLVKGNTYSGYVQVGIVSSEAGKDHIKYTKVSDFAGWIHRRTSGCGNHPFSPILTNGTVMGPPTFKPVRK